MCVRISTFENLVKPIGPPAPFIRTVVSGYFLTFSNLNTFDSLYQFVVMIPKWTAPGAPGEAPKDREFTTTAAGPVQDPSGTGNHNVIYDITGGPASGQTAVGELQYIGENDCIRLYLSDQFELCKGATAQVALLPFLGPGPDLIALDLFEVRGWIGIGWIPQGPISVSAQNRVLLTPEQRGTFIPVSANTAFDPVPLSDVSQLNTALPLATGQAENIITSTQPGENVFEFAEDNGVNIKLLRPFAGCLNQVL